MSDEKITKKMGINEVVGKYPETVEVFAKFGLHCIGCIAARFECIEDGAAAHGVDADKFVDELNKAVLKK
ncbi:MAG: disulfide oxidoreductase [Candidatus Nanohalarchaeota archaeon]|nr:MAG: disulfide oxidoreductase [Candidatus Nanohaloarchaeota archaeon]